MTVSKTDALAKFRLDGQVAVITGGASGIGLSTAVFFASVGAQVVIMDLKEDVAQRVAEGIRAKGGCASAFGLDISDEAAKRMIAQKLSGSIVFTASVMGLSGGGFGSNVNYQASKGGVVNMTRGLAVEWAEYGIRVNAVAPGWVRTPMIGAWSEVS